MSDHIKMAQKTGDAYSADRYVDWSAVAKMLFDRGYSDREVEAIMRSKWTRWAADDAPSYGRATAEDLARFLDDPRNDCARLLAGLIT